MRLKNTLLKEIDLKSPGWDDFIVTYKPDIEKIAASLERLGQIYPVILEKRENDRYRIVTGYKRVLAAKKIGWKAVEAKIYQQGEIRPRELFLLALATKAFDKSISPVDKAVALKKAQDIFGLEEELRQEIAPLLDVPPAREVIRNYIALAEADETIKDAVHLGQLPASQAFLLLPFQATDRLALFNLLQDLSANFNEAKEIVRNVSDLAQLQKKPIKEILAGGEIKEILQDGALSRRDRTSHLRRALRQKRYPLLSQDSEELKRRIRALALSPAVHMAYDPSFEKEEITISLKVADEDELAAVLKRLLAGLEAGNFARILSLLKGQDRQRPSGHEG